MIPFAAAVPLLSWLFDVTVKASLLILLVAAIQRVAGRRFDARWRHLLWMVVLVRLLMPAAPQSSWSLYNLLGERAAVVPAAHVTSPGNAVVVPRGADPVAAEATAVRVSRWIEATRWMLAIWLAGAAILALRLAVASWRTQRAVSRAWRRSPDSGAIQAIVDRERGTLGIRRAVRVVETDLVRTPALHGLLRPVILLPRGLVSSFSGAELRHVILHELWHLRRLDVAVSWVLSAVQALHWFNPVVWFAAARIREERELACDELALSCLEDEERRGYGMTILKLLERFRAPAPIPALVGIVNEQQKMKRRISMIASFRSRTRLSAVLFVTVMAVAVVGLTDAVGGPHKVMKNLDPATVATMDKLHQRVSFELTNATFAELLTAVSNATGVVITQSPDIATSSVQQARFTLKAEQIPAHAVLAESLMPFQLGPKPGADGVTVSKAEEMTFVHASVHHAEGEARVEKKVIVTDGTAHAGDVMVHVTDADDLPEGEGEKRVIVHRRKAADGEPEAIEEKVMVRKLHKSVEPDADGHIRRQMTLKMDENGVVTEGKLTLDIATK